jgi:hypothetical protein
MSMQVTLGKFLKKTPNLAVRGKFPPIFAIKLPHFTSSDQVDVESLMNLELSKVVVSLSGTGKL